MAEFTKDDFDRIKNEDYAEDEFGLGLKGYLLVRIVFYGIGVFAILGAVLALVLGTTTIRDLVSNATGQNSTAPVIKDTGFLAGLQICMFAQAIYTILSAVCVTLLYIKRTRIYAFIDLGLFIVFAAVFFVMGTFDIFMTSNGTSPTAWPLYFLLNPVFSFIALFVGDHFKYMPFK